MVRGIDKSVIFRDKHDKLKILEKMGAEVTAGRCTVYAWVLMDNHVHLLFKSGEWGISTVMRKVLTWYAQYFNRRYRRTGHLFQNRYKSILCEEETYLLALVRYIHLNPIRANIISTLEGLDDYPWSGHRAIIGKAEYPWMRTEDVLSEFAGTKRKAITEYRQFVKDGIGQKHDPQFSGGGLIRSQGGWSQVLSLRRKAEKEEYDERVLGSGDFVHAILREAEEKEKRQLKIRRTGLTLSRVIEEEVKKTKVSLQELKNGSRRKAVSETRAKVARRGVEELGVSCAELARHLGVCTSSVSRVIAKAEFDNDN
ncbi:MAG: transposase [Nitrospirae bacterium]|nr:transposase [Nitrospirota bacterium]